MNQQEINRQSRLIALISLAVAALIAGALIAAAQPYRATVGATSVKIIPARGLQNAVLWTNGVAVAQGVYRESSNHVYMAVTAGTTGVVAPVHLHGDASDGTVTWRRCYEADRAAMIIVNDSGVTVYGATDATAVTNTGFRLNINGGSLLLGVDFQGEVSVVSTGGANIVIAEEIEK